MPQLTQLTQHRVEILHINNTQIKLSMIRVDERPNMLACPHYDLHERNRPQLVTFLDAIASPSTYSCQSVGQ